MMAESDAVNSVTDHQKQSLDEIIMSCYCTINNCFLLCFFCTVIYFELGSCGLLAT